MDSGGKVIEITSGIELSIAELDAAREETRKKEISIRNLDEIDLSILQLLLENPSRQDSAYIAAKLSLTKQVVYQHACKLESIGILGKKFVLGGSRTTNPLYRLAISPDAPIRKIRSAIKAMQKSNSPEPDSAPEAQPEISQPSDRNGVSPSTAKSSASAIGYREVLAILGEDPSAPNSGKVIAVPKDCTSPPPSAQASSAAQPSAAAVLSKLPDFNSSWSEAVQLKWLNIVAALR